MVEICAGCGEELTSLHPALSRYSHGDICPNCGTLEAMYGDFIKKYSDPLNIEFPKEYIDVEKDKLF